MRDKPRFRYTTTHPNSKNNSLWKWKGIDDLNWTWSTNNKKEPKRFPVSEFLTRYGQEAEKLVLGPGFGVGIGCGAGIGLGLVGGLGFAGCPSNHLNLAFGLGMGCGVGLGVGYGQGIGGGFTLASLHSHLFSSSNKKM